MAAIRERAMKTIRMQDAGGVELRARLDVGEGQIVLHSRSGGGATARNPDYRIALVGLLQRLLDQGYVFSVFLDSLASKRSSPDLEDRLLIGRGDREGDAEEFASKIIRKSNEGSRSNGAWRRLLFLVDKASVEELQVLIQGQSDALPPISSRHFEEVGRDHILAAISEIREGRERPNRFEGGTKYRLVVGDGGPDLPPKKVFGIALSIALGRPVSPSDFSSGDGIFTHLSRHGFTVSHLERSETGMKEEGEAYADDYPASVPPLEEERLWIEGDRRVVSHLIGERSGALPKKFKVYFRTQHGRLFCERCGNDFVNVYGDAHAEACFDVHHKLPIADRATGRPTAFAELELLCSNCHRITHSEMRQDSQSS